MTSVSIASPRSASSALRDGERQRDRPAHGGAAMRAVLPEMKAAGAQLIVVLSYLDTTTEAQQVAS